MNSNASLRHTATTARFGRAPALLCALVGALFVTACEGEGPRSSQLYASPRGTIELMTLASQGSGSVPIHAIAVPSDIEPTVSDRFGRLLQERHPPLTTQPGAEEIPANGPDPRILLMHDTPTGFTAISACQGKSYLPSLDPTMIKLRVAVCYSDARLVEVDASVPRTDEGLNEAYETLLRQMVPQILVKRDTGR